MFSNITIRSTCEKVQLSQQRWVAMDSRRTKKCDVLLFPRSYSFAFERYVTFLMSIRKVWPPRNPIQRGKTGTGVGNVCEPSRRTIFRTRLASVVHHHRKATVIIATVVMTALNQRTCSGVLFDSIACAWSCVCCCMKKFIILSNRA